MAFFDIFAWIVLLLLVSTGVGVIVLLGLWPARVAQARNHPQAEAIAIGSWLTLFLGFVLWPLIAIWAHMKTVPGDGGTNESNLGKKLAALEERLARVEADKSASNGGNTQ